MVFDGSGEVRPGIEEACNSCVVLCEELDDCWRNEDSWVGLVTESFHGGSIGITGDDNSLLFELLSLLLSHWLSRGVLCEDLDDCWQTEDSLDGLMTELFNGRETYITGNDNSLLSEWHSLRLKPRLSREVVRRLPWLLPVPILWRLPIPFGTWHDECNMSLWWCCVPVILIFNGHQNVRSNFLAQQLQSYLSSSTRNKIDFDIFFQYYPN